ARPRYKLLPRREYRGATQYPVRVTGLRLETIGVEFECFPEHTTRIYPPRYTEPQAEVQTMIKSLFEQHGSGVEVDFKVISRRDNQLQRAVVTFRDSGVAETLYRELRNARHEFLGNDTLNLKLVFTTKHRVPAEIYHVVSTDIQRIVNQSEQPLELKERGHGRYPRWVSISGSDRVAVATANLELKKLCRGSVVCNDEGHAVWDSNLNSNSGKKWLAKAAAQVGVHVRCDHRSRTIAIFGAQEKCRDARASLLEAYQSFLDSLRAPVRFRLPDGITEDTIAERVEAIRELYGEDKVDFVAGQEAVTVHCTSQEVFKLSRIIGGEEKNTITSPTGANCAVCPCKAENPVQTDCNHWYCKACLHNLLLNVIETRHFPIRCIGSLSDPESKSITCEEPLPLTLVRSILTTEELSTVHESALTGYIQTHLGEFYYCPTPDCSSIFPTTPTTTSTSDSRPSRTCPQCLLTHCPTCRTATHPTQTCVENQLPETEKTELWKRKHGIKPCPMCHIDIEKNDGCNHMTCICGTHFCWLCAIVLDEDIIFEHVDTCDGTREWMGEFQAAWLHLHEDQERGNALGQQTEVRRDTEVEEDPREG
ncbi:hypothetical protein EX30DRAFT_389536, partial [Ascodesmis nigricans]